MGSTVVGILFNNSTMQIHELKKQVKWKDLRHLSPIEKLIENSLCWPPLIISLSLLYYGFYWVAAPITAFYFLAAMRQCHNGYHHALGISKKGTKYTLMINSMFMLTSLHAVKLNHIEHHKHNLSHEDYERKVADMTWWKSLLQGPAHWWHNHHSGRLLANKNEKRQIALELSLFFGLIAAALLMPNPFLLLHIGLMVIAQLLTPFFTIWITHHGHDEKTIAHIRKNNFLDAITLGMLIHCEHHLFPSVPTIKIKELRKRIEAAKKD